MPVGAQVAGSAAPARGTQQPSAPSAPNPQSGRSGDSRSARRGPGSAYDWWNDTAVQKEIGLSTAQAKRIDDYYQQRAKQMKNVSDSWFKESDELTNMTKAAVVDEATYQLQVIRVEGLRTLLNQSRLLMLYHIQSKELQPDQNKKLQAYFERMDRERQAAAMNGRGR
jgi:hypothetical protein